MCPTMYPVGLGLDPYDGWSFMIPTNLPTKDSIDELDLFFFDQSQAAVPRSRSGTFTSSLSVEESILTNSPSTGSDSYFPAVFAQSDEDQTSPGPSSQSQPQQSMFPTRRSALQIQTQIEDVTRSQSVAVRGGLVKTNPLEMDSKVRRREQNRKAQTVFRQKRKHEVRRLQQEIADLKEQLAGMHQGAACASWTVCAKCRAIYPRSPTREPKDDSGHGSVHHERHSVDDTLTEV